LKDWIRTGTNRIEVLSRNQKKAEEALVNTQISTKSPLGAIIYETGGILIDEGWIRILGSGNKRLNRSVPSWNYGKSFKRYGEQSKFLLIGDDAIGGFFAINGGAFNGQSGDIFYYAPDNLEWENLDVGFTQFLNWCFSSDIGQFYKGLRWNNWRDEIKELHGDKAINFQPFLFTKYKNINSLNRRAIAIEEMWNLQMELRNQIIT